MHLKDTPPRSPDSIHSVDGLEDDILNQQLSDEDDNEIDDNTSDYEPAEDDDDMQDFEDGLDIVASPLRDDAELVFTKHTGSVFCCHLDPKSGNLAVTGGEDDKAYVWETHTGNVILECKGHRDSVTCAEFNHDGNYVATGDMMGLIKVWKLSSKMLVWETSVGDLSWMKWHPGSNVLLAGVDAGEVYMWKIPSGDCKVLAGHGEKTEVGVILPDGKRAAVGYSDGTVKVLDLKAMTVLHEVRAHSGSLMSIDCHPDNNLLITSGADELIIFFKTQNGKVASVQRAREESSTSVNSGIAEVARFCQDPSLNIAVTGDLKGEISIWDVSREALRKTISQGSGLTKLVWVKNSPMFYTGALDGVIRLFDARSGDKQSTLSGHEGDILDIALASDNSILLSASDDHTARVFSLAPPER
uniref:Angio-associated migratory cell protein n=1 Tax=Timema shepardi TaxID=629360 RepID=A0A7R9AVL2_TIMSH|nr:unnamed protein product [Timema shepardi]